MAVVYMPQGGSVNKKQVEGIIKEIVNLEDYAKTSDVPTKLSELTNDKDFATVNRVLEEIAKSQLEGSEVDLSAYATKEFVADEIEKIDVTEQLGDYAKKSELPTNVSQLTNDKNYLTSIPSEYITETELNAKGYLTTHQDISAYAKKTEIPTKVSQLTNDSKFLTGIPAEYVTETKLNDKGYLTQHQDISGLASKAYIGDMFSFDSNGYLVVIINGVTKKFAPVDSYDNAQVIDDTELSDIMGDIPYDN
jgi:hypothetical protein